jgi:WS/DGAT/MGAT family acyltransferase
MRQLSPLDSIFLSMETPETPGHIGGLAILDAPSGGFDYDRFVEFVAERLALCPRFSWKLQQVPLGLDLPYWVEEGELDLNQHIRRAALPSPGSQRELAELAGFLFERPIELDKPLWEMHWIEGLQGGRVALLWKIHHCLMDGVSGAGLVELLFDLEPEPGDRPLIMPEEEEPAGEPGSLFAMAKNVVVNSAKRPGAAGRHLTKLVSSTVSAIRRDGFQAATSMAPATSFNGTIGTRRGVAWTTVSLSEVLDLKKQLGVTVNDVVLSITGGAIRRYLGQRDELPKESLFAGVPVSTRSENDKSIGNQITEVSMYWGTDIADPLERVRTISKRATAVKKSIDANAPNLLEALSECLSPTAIRRLMGAMVKNSEDAPLPCNAVVSNVRMTPVPMYIAGARIAEMVPISLLAPTQGLNITVLSYNGELHFGLTFDPALVPGSWLICEGIAKAVIELQEATSRDVTRA